MDNNLLYQQKSYSFAITLTDKIWNEVGYVSLHSKQLRVGLILFHTLVHQSVQEPKFNLSTRLKGWMGKYYFWKMADWVYEVNPFQKLKDKSFDYRPVTLICSMSKVLEKVINSDIPKYFEQYELIHDERYRVLINIFETMLCYCMVRISLFHWILLKLPTVHNMPRYSYL